LIAVFAWRDAKVVVDPLGVGAELKAFADAWTWDDLTNDADAWVVDRLVGLSEYVSKLERALAEERRLDAAAIRSQLALGLADVAAVVNRITSSSENGLWETIADSGGEECRELLEQALAVGDEDLNVSARAAVALFRWLAHAADPLFQPAQREIVLHAGREPTRR
jgi:hypothetical protein